MRKHSSEFTRQDSLVYVLVYFSTSVSSFARCSVTHANRIKSTETINHCSTLKVALGATLTLLYFLYILPHFSSS